MKRQLSFFIMLLVLPAGHMLSQEKVWTLNDCILYALEHNPGVSSRHSTNTIYQQDYREAIGKLLPSVSAGMSTGFNFGRGVDEETNTYINVNSFSNNYDISASMTLFDGLAGYRRVKIGRMNKLKGKHELEDAKDMVAYDTMEAFYNLLYNTDLLRTAEEQLQESTRSFEQVKRMEELGVKGMPDVAEAEARMAGDRYHLTRQDNLLTLSLIQLKEKMNYPIDEALAVADNDADRLVVKEGESPIEIYRRSMNIHPKARIAESDLFISTQHYRAMKGSALPSLSVRAGASSNFFRNMDGSAYVAFSEQLKNKRGEYVSFSLSIPLFNGFSRSANIKRAKAQINIAENNRDETLRKLYSDIEQAVADANGQVDEYHQAVKQREAAEVAHRVNRRKYEQGLIDPILLHTSANRLLSARAEEHRAKYMYRLKHRLVNYYKGEPLFVEQP